MLTNCGYIQRVFVRTLTIKQAPQVSSSVSVLSNSISDAKNIENVEALPNLKTMGTVKMEAVGTPPSVLTVGTPPSLPLFVRRRTILTIQGNHQNISASNETIHWFKRLIHGNFVSRYQKLLGTEPFSVLVTSSSPTIFPSLFLNTTTKSCATINLDGVNDWAFFKPHALHAYSGPSLNIDIYRLPKRISLQLSRRLKLSSKDSTGLYHWSRSGYTFVNGRGSVALVGNGVIYSVNIADGEELLINREHLLGLSVNGPYDLQNCVAKYSYSLKKAEKTIIAETPPPKMAQVTSWSDFVVNAKYYWWKVSSFLATVKNKSPDVLVGNQTFLRVVGPRTVLLQSGGSHQSFERNHQLPTLGQEEVQEPVLTSSDFLNIVTIDPKNGPTISSVSDFKDTVQDLQKHRS